MFTRKRFCHAILGILICVTQFMMLWSATDKLSPNPDEFAHLVAGVSYWQTGDPSLYNVNPPLVRLVGALPCVLHGARVPFLDIKLDRTKRLEFDYGRSFVEQNPQTAFLHLVNARRACLVFVVAGTVAVMLLGGMLINPLAGLVAGLIWAFNPITLGYSIQLGCDMPGASIGAWALLTSALVVEKPTLRVVFLAGIWLGLAIVTKSTWIVAASLWPIGFMAIWGYARKSRDNAQFSEYANRKFLSVLSMVSIILLIAYGVMILAYRGHGTFVKLGDYSFVSATLSGDTAVRNRFRGTLAESIPVPFPRAFVEGIDQQWEDFDRPRWAFLFGQWKHGGWWWYYLAALCVKLPIGWILLVVASLRFLRHDPRLVAIGIVLPTLFVALVSVKTNMNEHVRYVWVILPMLAVLASASVALPSGRIWRLVSVTLTGWIVAAGLVTFPFGIAYSNEWFGGPSRIAEHLAASNVDWNQGWVEAKKWLEANSSRDRFIGIVRPKWHPLSAVGIETIDNSSLPDGESLSSDIPILVLIGVHDRMEIERRNKNAFSLARKIETIAYSVEVYEFPYSVGFRVHGASWYCDPSEKRPRK